jgi:hypothetical protein
LFSFQHRAQLPPGKELLHVNIPKILLKSLNNVNSSAHMHTNAYTDMLTATVCTPRSTCLTTHISHGHKHTHTQTHTHAGACQGLGGCRRCRCGCGLIPVPSERVADLWPCSRTCCRRQDRTAVCGAVCGGSVLVRVFMHLLCAFF